MRAEKTQMVGEIKGLVENRPIVLITYKGLKANTFNEFRNTLAELKAVCHVVPNTLLKKAAEALGMDKLAGFELTGDTALVSGACDPVVLMKCVRDFLKGKDQMTVKLAVVEGALLNQEDAFAMADLPSREVLLAQLLGLLQAPGSQLVRVLNAKLASIVYVLDAYCKKKDEQVA